MGIHMCRYCLADGTHDKGNDDGGSQDVTLKIMLRGQPVCFKIPWTGLAHYMLVHNYLPPREFVDAIMHGEVIAVEIAQTKGLSLAGLEVEWPDPVEVGYLEYPANIPTGDVPDGFLNKLRQIIQDNS